MLVHQSLFQNCKSLAPNANLKDLTDIARSKLELESDSELTDERRMESFLLVLTRTFGHDVVETASENVISHDAGA